jgi:hypothetical protein
MQFSSATQKGEIMSFSGKWMGRKIIMSNKISSPTKTNVTCFLSFVEASVKKPKIMKVNGKLLVRLKGEGKGSGDRGIRKSNRGGEHGQSTLYSYMEIS